METTRNERKEEFFSDLNIDIDILNMINVENVESFNDVYQSIDENQGFDVEVIYYENAMDYLRESDPSLNESLSIASEMGFTPDNLNSEVLASLLKSQNLRDEFNDLESEIESFFSELEDIEDVDCFNCGETILEDVIMDGICPLCECKAIEEDN